MPDRDYDFQVNVLLWKFNFHDRPYTWNTGLFVKTDVEMQFNIAEFEGEKTTMFGGTMPVDFYVNGEKRLLSEGSGDHRRIVTGDGYDIDFFFASIGVNIRVFIRPDSVSRHNTRIPGSFSTFVCLPDELEGMENFSGMLGSPDGDGDNDWIKADGSIATRTSDRFNFCTVNFCIDDEADSIMIYDTADDNQVYDFNYYQRCDWSQTGQPGRRLGGGKAQETRKLEVLDETLAMCERVGNDPGCLLDGEDNPSGAAVYVEMTEKRTSFEKLHANKPTRQEVGGWSTNWKDVDESIDDDDWCVGYCIKDGKRYLPMGSIDPTIFDADDLCIELQGSCLTDSDCCGRGASVCGVEGKCEIREGFTACPDDGCRRLVGEGHKIMEEHIGLEDFVLKRPDLPEERSIKYLHSEL